MSKYQKQVSLGYSPDGVRIRKWIHASSQQELKRKERELLQNTDQELQSNKRFGAYAEEWFETYKRNKSHSIQDQYTYALKCLAPLNDKQLKRITRMDIQKIVNDYSDRPASARLIAMTFKSIMDSASADNLITPRLWKIDLPKYEKAEKRPLTESEKEAIRKADLDPQARLFVDIELYLGLRPEETRALTPHDFDLKERTVTISKAVACHKEPVLKSTKTGVTRTLPIPDALCDEIRAYNAQFRGFYYFANEEGELMNRDRYQAFRERIFRHINKALGGTYRLDLLNGMTMYTFRHNRATELYYLQGVSTKKKAEYMGHSEMMFLKTYSHLDNDQEDIEALRGSSCDKTVTDYPVCDNL